MTLIFSFYTLCFTTHQEICSTFFLCLDAGIQFIHFICVLENTDEIQNTHQVNKNANGHKGIPTTNV